MNVTHKKILLTGATGGVGQALAIALAKHGARIALVGRQQEKLIALSQAVMQAGGIGKVILNDFSTPNSAQTVVAEAIQSLGGLDIIINNAGIIDFVRAAHQEPQVIDNIMHLNAVIPMQLTRAALPHFLAQGAGHIVNIGSIFGSIGFPHYAAYSASKFALRGYSQALRRELFDTPIKVTYVAPRAIKTAMNDESSTKMLAETNTAMDTPEFVADTIVQAIKSSKEECYIGQPESFFAWLNGVFPSAVSGGLKKATLAARKYLN